MSEIIPKHGGYRKLKSFQIADLVYDGAVIFCDRFIDKRSRTQDQMVQAARSGRQNIAEGSMASATSKKTELKLTGVARASLEELILDLEDVLRQRGLRKWDKNDPEALAVRNAFRPDPSDKSDSSDPDPFGLAHASAELAANTLLCLTHQASFLLRRQLEFLEQQFLQAGGITERLFHARREARLESSGKSDASDGSDPSDKRPHPA